jgi:integrase
LLSVENAHKAVLSTTDLAFVLYDLRHTFATRRAGAGCPLPALARILGHTSLRTIQRYVHPSQVDMDAAMEKYSGPASVRLPARDGVIFNDLQ